LIHPVLSIISLALLDLQFLHPLLFLRHFTVVTTIEGWTGNGTPETSGFSEGIDLVSIGSVKLRWCVIQSRGIRDLSRAWKNSFGGEVKWYRILVREEDNVRVRIPSLIERGSMNLRARKEEWNEIALR
jgi:hypothetical protein